MRRLGVICIFICIAWYGVGQFVPQPLNYPGPGYWPVYISISDPDHVWVGTIHEGGNIFPFSARTNDGGSSWNFDSIPVPGKPVCTSICQWDENICFFVFSDMVSSGGTIWKTTDGGSSWSNTTTTQFTGGFANFYHAFTADTGVAMGDPTNGYFEIEITTNGGLTWTRIPSANIPGPLTNEAGINHVYSAVGNSIWFATDKGRCYRSNDRGQNWEVTEIVHGGSGMFGVCFSTPQKGVFWKGDALINDVVVTNDGGVTWDSVPFPSGFTVGSMSRVGGFDGGIIFTTWKTSMGVSFTPDLFTTVVQVEPSILSSGFISFLDATTGWLSAGESGTNEIYRFNGVISAAQEALNNPGRLSIIPNPSNAEALVKIPLIVNVSSLLIRVTDMTGKVVYLEPVETLTGWAKLASSEFADGAYLIELLSGRTIIGRERWLVSH